MIGLHPGRAGRQRAGLPRARRRASSTASRSTSRTPPAASADDVLEEFLLEFYWERPAMPPEMIVPLDERHGRRRAARRAARRQGHGARRKRGPKRRLLELAQRNAELAAQAETERLARTQTSRIEALERLRDALGLRACRCASSATTSATSASSTPVGSMVVFEGGLPKKAHYRKFALRDVDGPGRLRHDEPGAAAALRAPRARAAPRELRRELRRAARPGRRRRRQGAALGRAARRCATPASAVDLVSLAKQREEVFVPGRRDPLPLPADDPARCCCSASATRRIASP